MTTLRRLANAAVLVVFVANVFAADDERAQDLFEQHRWFELRDVSVADPYAAALTKGTLASAFNRPVEAERELKLAIHSAKGTEQLNAAREKLAVLYLRQGRSREAVAQMRIAVKRDSSRADLQSMLHLFGPLAGYPPFSTHMPKGGAELECEVKDDGVWLMAEVNGKPVTWLLDTGFNFSGISESEARSLGIRSSEGGGSFHDFAGGEATTKAGVIARIALGGIEFRNLPVLIFPDRQPPWQEWTAGRRGVLGLPVALALQTLSWTRAGKCTAGFTRGERGEANLAFDDFTPVVRTTLNGKPLDFVFDTGNQGGTQLWGRFKADFPELLASDGGITGRMTVTQVGGASDHPTLEIPQLKFEAGGMTVLLQPAKLFGKPVGNDYQHGLLGMDVFSQAREILLDFRSMTLVMR